MSDNQRIHLRLRQEEDYRCTLAFDDGVPPLTADEPPPLGQGQGPSPVQLLLAAVSNCLTDSLLFALRKFKQDAEPLSAHAIAEVGRNAENRLRVVGIEVDLSLGKPAAEMQHIPRILDQFEAFCTVSQSVAAGIPIRLRVFDRDGQLLKGE
ncbi:OsmC family protein [Pseudomonas indica]|uniref:Uncharacterized OsmC-related protein n=1 Tax=Pseudomonas indica TaxID=137658 RepID=A0A1G9GIE6_9PSED|nr:OsmC family protein [Pseudomonas indica]MBU3055720.1 OsmC family protein [Pseudomonas indica]PAU64299.1 peroxiredoxin [Pseudomonas indica]SDL00436.1 Uncharacterized OsmC-related protein [Pseudomonas indica]